MFFCEAPDKWFNWFIDSYQYAILAILCSLAFVPVLCISYFVSHSCFLLNEFPVFACHFTMFCIHRFAWSFHLFSVFFSFYVQDHFSKILSTSFLLDHLQVMCIPSKEVLIALLKMVSFCLIWQCRKINHCMFEMSKENCNRAIYGFKRRLF